MTPETNSRIADWRAKALAGQLTEADLAEAIRLLRADRVGASIASDKSRRAKAKTEIPNADDLLAELGGL
jgi:hypothetical protein